MEAAVKIANGPSADLSEQFLVSCNQGESSCNGGYFPLHITRINSGNFNQKPVLF
jgi:hypothetical protein